MVRPFKCRHISSTPQYTYFKPRGIPLCDLDEIIMSIDEFEAIRLADSEGLYHEEAAERMNIARQTFSKLLNQARQKVADSLVNGKAIKIEGGAYVVQNEERGSYRGRRRCHRRDKR